MNSSSQDGNLAHTYVEDGASELLKEYDAKHGIEVSSQVPQVREGGGPSQKNETRTRNRS